LIRPLPSDLSTGATSVSQLCCLGEARSDLINV
jgi:hypothetical protein